MANQLKRTLPILAIVGACVLVADVVFLGIWKASRPGEDPVIRSAVEQALAPLRELRPVSAEDPVLARTVSRALTNSHIATVWLIDSDGRFLLSEGSTALSTPSGSTVEDMATDDARGLLGTLPAQTFTEEQETWLLAASAIRREGSHSDIYRHLLRPINGLDGTPVALAGVAYEHAGWAAGLGWMAAVLLAVLSLAVYWMALPLWVFLDSSERGDRAVPWATFVLMGNLVALIAYLLARAPAPSLPGGEIS